MTHETELSATEYPVAHDTTQAPFTRLAHVTVPPLIVVVVAHLSTGNNKVNKTKSYIDGEKCS